MADTVTSTTLANTSRKLRMKFTNLSDGTGESAVVKVDKSTFVGLNGAEPSYFKITKIIYDIGNSMRVAVKVNRTSPLTVAVLQGFGTLDYGQFGGILCDGSGGTGDIEFTTSGHALGDGYDITLYLTKID